ncbi:MAG: hypothetical protein JWM55_218 [Acidimicrobiaceae bacterium]|nr:hypothetical protein [Acidimicrobiaceae bacterium]
MKRYLLSLCAFAILIAAPLALTASPSSAAVVGPNITSSCNFTSLSGPQANSVGPQQNITFSVDCANLPNNTTSNYTLQLWFELGPYYYSTGITTCAADGTNCGNTGMSPPSTTTGNLGWYGTTTAAWATHQPGATSQCGGTSWNCGGQEPVANTGSSSITWGTEAIYASTTCPWSSCPGTAGIMQGNGQPLPNSMLTTPSIVFGAHALGCTFEDVTGQEGQVSDGTTDYPFTIDFAGGADAIVLVDPNSTDTTTFPLFGHNFTDDSFETGYTPGGSIPSPLTAGITHFASGHVINPDMWCHTGATKQSNGSWSGGTWVDWGLVSSYEAVEGSQGVVFPGGPPGVGQCFDLSGFDLYSPATWVSGALHTFTCIMQWAFQPTMCGSIIGTTLITSGCVDFGAFQSALSSATPFGYVAQVTDAFTSFTGGLSTSSSGCGPTIAPFSSITSGPLHGLHAFSVRLPAPSSLGCGGADDSTIGNLWGYRSWVLALFTFSIWMTAAVMLWRMAPWHRSGDGIEIVKQFGGLSDHIMENGAEVYQTNEGSD